MGIVRLMMMIESRLQRKKVPGLHGRVQAQIGMHLSFECCDFVLVLGVGHAPVTREHCGLARATRCLS